MNFTMLYRMKIWFLNNSRTLQLRTTNKIIFFSILEPRGLIRLLQFIFAIFAFATACNGGSNLSLSDNANNNPVTASWSYPYDLTSTPLVTDLNQTQNYLSLSNDIKPSAQFFVFTGVTSMLLSLALLIVYVFMDRQYRNDERLPVGDFIVTLIWMIFWIAASSAWAQGVSNLRSQTSIDYVTNLVSSCSSPNLCTKYECKWF